MMDSIDSLTTTDILAAVTEILTSGGYRRITNSPQEYWSTASSRIFEDPYAIVAVVVYDTWKDLSSGWVDAQAALVELISEHIRSTEAKAWDGYLVLLTNGFTSSESEITEIRYDTSRVRKLVATGDELRTLADVRRVILPLLPLGKEFQVRGEESVLEELPKLLSQKNLPEDTVRVVIRAFSDQKPLIEQLDEYRIQT